jgi:RNA polymerase sigma factor (sigma-70 family)
MNDDAQLELLHREHAGAVRAYVRRRIGRDEADDVVADVFVVAWRRIEDVPAEARTWLLGIARRVLANRHRAAKRQRALYERLAREAETETVVGSLAGNERVGAVLRALASLAPADREVLLLVTWDGLSHAEAAEVLGVSPTTSAMRLHRARQRLERALEDAAPDAPDARRMATRRPMIPAANAAPPNQGTT